MSTLPNRKNLRLPHYDYSNDGAYFITICTQHRLAMFGEIINAQVHLNDAGKMLEHYYHQLENKFPTARCGEYVIMPDHFHCIIHIENDNQHSVGYSPCANPTVGVDLRVNPNINPNKSENHNIVDPNTNPNNFNNPPTRDMDKHIGLPLHRVVQWFKTMTTNAYIHGVKNNDWQPFNQRLWQRNYYEHVVRNYDDYLVIAEYIANNPLKWALNREQR